MLHAQSAPSMTLDQDFPVSIEAQFLGGPGEGERPTANLCTPGTNVVMDGELIIQHYVSSSSKTYHGDGWVTVEMAVRGNELVRHVIEGETVIAYSVPQIGGDNKAEVYPVPDGTPLSEGYIALQAESHPIEFRKVELLDLEQRWERIWDSWSRLSSDHHPSGTIPVQWSRDFELTVRGKSCGSIGRRGAPAHAVRSSAGTHEVAAQACRFRRIDAVACDSPLVSLASRLARSPRRRSSLTYRRAASRSPRAVSIHP